jgi:hypothetical protein
MSREARITFLVPLINTSFRLAADSREEFTFIAPNARFTCSV